MNTSRIRTGHPRGEVAPNTWGDFEWARNQHNELLAQYGTCIALIFEKKVIGVILDRAVLHIDMPQRVGWIEIDA